jgi:CHASE2 domain-containing sensor protein
MTSAPSVSIVQPPNNTPYIIAVVVMMAIGVLGVVIVTVMRSGQDNALVIGAILGFLGPTTLSLLAFMKAQETHLSVNSRLDAFMQNAILAAHAEGASEGRKEGRQSADARTDRLAETSDRKDAS